MYQYIDPNLLFFFSLKCNSNQLSSLGKKMENLAFFFFMAFCTLPNSSDLFLKKNLVVANQALSLILDFRNDIRQDPPLVQEGIKGNRLQSLSLRVFVSKWYSIQPWDLLGISFNPGISLSFLYKTNPTSSIQQARTQPFFFPIFFYFYLQWQL